MSQQKETGSNPSIDEEAQRQADEPEEAGTADFAAAAAAEMLPSILDQQKKRSAGADPGSDKSTKRVKDSADSGGEDAALLEGISPEELAKMSRSERKRHREKKRRSDVNKGFDELMTLLLEIDPRVRAEAEERARRGQWKGQLGAHEDNLLSRVDLISRTVEVLRRIHRENEERKVIIASLTRGGSADTRGIGASAMPGAGAGYASLGSSGFSGASAVAGTGDEATLMMSSGNQADTIASLRAAAESRHFYNQALMNRIAATHQQQSSLTPHELLGYSQAAHLQRHPGAAPSDMFALAAGRNAPSGLSTNPAYLAAAAAAGGSNPASSGANSALTRHYLQLLRDLQDTSGFNNPNNNARPSGGGGNGNSAS